MTDGFLVTGLGATVTTTVAASLLPTEVGLFIGPPAGSPLQVVTNFTTDPLGRRTFAINVDPQLITPLAAQNVFVRVTTAAGALEDRIRLVESKEGLVDISGPGLVADGFLLIPPQGRVRVGVSGSSQTVFYELVLGTPGNPGVTLVDSSTLGPAGDFADVVQISTDDVAALCNGPSFIRAVDALTGVVVGTGTVRLTDVRKVTRVDDGTDGPTDNAIAIVFQYAPSVIAGSVDATAFPGTVTAVNLRETQTGALVAPAVQVAAGQFAIPFTPVTPAQIVLFEQNQLDIELVTTNGIFANQLQDASVPGILPGASPGSNGELPYGNFVQQPLIRFGYGVELLNGDPNAAAIPIIGLELHDPPQSLAGLGLDDIVFVKLLATLPLQILDARGIGFWTQQLPNDTTFVGLPLFGQIAILSGADGLSLSNAFVSSIGPN
ncbi:MAG: hypothetical protein KDE27_06230 [Planctomycetes bacterium]|nr:hypothetical protein [Planctomycetota bacterium]